MKIVLRIDGEDKTFSNDFVEAIIFRNALKLNKKFSEGVDIADESTFDTIVDFVVSAFGNKFGVDDVWKGLSVQNLQTETMRIYNEVLNMGGLEIGAVNKDATGDEGNEAGK